MARLNDSSSSEARMIAECVLCTRLSCDAGHSSSASSMAAVLTTSWLASTSLVSRFCCSRAVFRSTGLTQLKEAQTCHPLAALLLDEPPELLTSCSAQGLFLRSHEQPTLPLQAPGF